jgi:glycosyltransferase involved in cell wall biosynthesis
MLEAVAILSREHGLDLQLRLVGGPLTDADRSYEASLRRVAASLEIEHLVTFEGTVPFSDVALSYHGGRLFLNLSSTASLDKAILESMASGCVPISRNAAFAAFARDHGLEWLVPEPGAHGLARCVVDALDRTGEDRESLTARLRRLVEDNHSLDSLLDQLMIHMTQLAACRGAPP